MESLRISRLCVLEGTETREWRKSASTLLSIVCSCFEGRDYKSTSALETRAANCYLCCQLELQNGNFLKHFLLAGPRLNFVSAFVSRVQFIGIKSSSNIQRVSEEKHFRETIHSFTVPDGLKNYIRSKTEGFRTFYSSQYGKMFQHCHGEILSLGKIKDEKTPYLL